MVRLCFFIHSWKDTGRPLISFVITFCTCMQNLSCMLKIHSNLWYSHSYTLNLQNFVNALRIIYILNNNIKGGALIIRSITDSYCRLFKECNEVAKIMHLIERYHHCSLLIQQLCIKKKLRVSSHQTYCHICFLCNVIMSWIHVTTQKVYKYKIMSCLM